MPSVSTEEDFAACWNHIESVVSRLMSGPKAGMELNLYLEGYSAVIGFCEPQARGDLPAHLRGEKLYFKLIEYLTSHLKNLIPEFHTPNKDVLQFYIQEWDRYYCAAKHVHRLFRYFNQRWVRRERDEGKRNIYPAGILYLVKWREVLLDKVHEQVVEAVLRLIETQRNGEMIGHREGQIKAVVDSLVLGDIDEVGSFKPHKAYQYYFEKPFLKATAEFYQRKSKRFITENSIIEYIKEAQIWLDEEDNRIDTCLHPDAAAPLMTTCHQSIIAEHSALLTDEFQVLLDNDREDDMAHMYNLVSRFELDSLWLQFESHVRNQGLSSLQKVASDSGELDPKAYVDALLETHAKYQALIEKAFHSNPGFTRALDCAFRGFINQNEVCKSSSSNSPELLARYTYILLRRSGGNSMEDLELEAALIRVMIIFEYIEDKDIFQRAYSHMLARRLIYANSLSDSAEDSMIEKLEQACGREYTDKWRRMLQDLVISKDLSTSYRNHVASLEVDKSEADKPEVDKSEALVSTFRILGSAFWPLSTPDTKFNLPREIESEFQRFGQIYKRKNDHQKLTWLWNLCRGDLRANYIQNGKTPYTFHVSLYQMGILLLFNDKDARSYEDIVAETKLSPEVLEQAMAAILRAEVLIITPDGRKEAVPGQMFQLNMEFKSEKTRINLNQGGFKCAKGGNSAIELDRKIQSAIVRIMKARKRMNHVELVNLIKASFKPELLAIENCIETLIEKEFLERLNDEELGYLV
ncbi:related to SCF complex member Cullin 1 [Cephalotrichum gorgonifer]|uniref:Related to SCF complex member Cullin 1 n=1 Tax=Cephalotrichum gorgonifer TaxID=2041049 RepID=A0AAE8N6S5_9PEZI|nr:related to SCF complex member Cullin 1 [Cephalotrichum gorgonifer]